MLSFFPCVSWIVGCIYISSLYFVVALLDNFAWTRFLLSIIAVKLI